MSSPLRADARRNLDRVLDAAAQAFAEQGPNVSMDEIARRAGVGHGTVFRRFRNKEGLIGAVVAMRLAELSDTAEALAAEPDVGSAFETFFWHAAETFARDRCLFEGIPMCVEMPEVAVAKERLHVSITALASRAQAAGTLRRDVTADDLPIIIGSTILGAAQAGVPDAWRRFIAVVLDGLRVGGSADGAARPPAARAAAAAVSQTER